VLRMPQPFEWAGRSSQELRALQLIKTRHLRPQKFRAAYKPASRRSLISCRFASAVTGLVCQTPVAGKVRLVTLPKDNKSHAFSTVE